VIYCDLGKDLFNNITDEPILKTRHIGKKSTNKENERYIQHLDMH
jgi:hypothetical protein